MSTVSVLPLATPASPANRAVRLLNRTPLRLWHTTLGVFVFGGMESTHAQTLALGLGVQPVLAAGTFMQGVNMIWTFIIIIAFIIGSLVALNGWLEKQRGEDGNKKLIAGIGAPLSLLAMKGIMNLLFPGAGIGSVQESQPGF